VKRIGIAGWRSPGAALVYIAPAVVILVAIFVYPLADAFYISLHRWNLISNVQRWAGAGNYLAILADPAFPQVIRVTLFYSALSLLFEMLLGLALALLVRAGLRRRLPGFPVIRVLILAPLLVAPLLWAFYFRSFYSPQFGLFNAILEGVGLPPVLWVNDADIAIFSLVLADVWQWTPFVFSILLAGLLALPIDIVEAARVDGAGNWRILFAIELPLLRPVLLVTALIRAIDSLRYLDLVLVITQGGPGRSTEILNFLAYRVSFLEFQFGRGAALAFVVFALVMLAAGALLRVMWKSTSEAPAS
jgi:multiple sugar transport system permease protein